MTLTAIANSPPAKMVITGGRARDLAKMPPQYAPRAMKAPWAKVNVPDREMVRRLTEPTTL